MEDPKIIEMFFARSEQAVATLAEKYGRICFHLASNMVGDERDAMECVNDAYLAAWNTIPPQRPEKLSAYLCRLVRLQALRRLEKAQAKKRTGTLVCIDELADIVGGNAVEEAVDARELGRAIDEFLDGQSRQNRLLFVRRYWYADSFEELARQTGMKEGAVRTRLCRLRAQLKEHLIAKGVNL